MKYLKGDIWYLFDSTEIDSNPFYIVIPTNLGYTKNKENVMGAGLALQLKNRNNFIASWYGEVCYKRALNKDDGNITILDQEKIIFFATKPLIQETPHLSWKQNSSLKTIEKSCKELVFYLQNRLKDKMILLPLVGCGNGKLDSKIVKPILQEYFKDFDNVFLVEGNNERY